MYLFSTSPSRVYIYFQKEIMIRHEKYYAGIGAGIVGGVVFCFIMSIVGLSPLVAKIMEKEYLVLEWMGSLIYSGFIGGLYVWWFGKKTTTIEKSILSGLVHGAVWWMLGALIIRPLVLGLPLQLENPFDATNTMFFLSHLAYGVVLGNIFFQLNRSIKEC